MTARACQLCHIAASPEIAEARWNRPLITTSSFLVVPSLGALVEGWLLILPRTHRLSMAQLSPKELVELRVLAEDLARQLQSMYGLPTVMFEHGAHADGQPIGCSVDHAHLHVVPIGLDLVQMARDIAPQLKWHHLNDLFSFLAAHDGCQSYIVLRTQDGSTRLTWGPSPLPSQLFRRAIAQGIGRDQEWSWRNHPQLEIVSRTVERFGTTQPGEFERVTGFD